jgi:hypothetical protein
VTERDTRLRHPWLRINRVLRVMLHTHWSAEAWSQVRVEFRRGLACRSSFARNHNALTSFGLIEGQYCGFAVVIQDKSERLVYTDTGESDGDATTPRLYRVRDIAPC